MGDPDIDINSAQNDGGRIHSFISSDDGRLTSCESYEGNLVRTKTSRRHHGGTV